MQNFRPFRSGQSGPHRRKSCHDLRTGQRIASLILDLAGDGDHRRLLPLRQGKRDGRILRSRRDSLPRRLLILLQQGFAQNHLAELCALRLSAGGGYLPSRPGVVPSAWYQLTVKPPSLAHLRGSRSGR